VIPPPRGYLKRLREICTQYDILLIFDEVITGFGPRGTPFAAQYFYVMPDMIRARRGLTNGAVPMAAVFVRQGNLRRLHARPGRHRIVHGYTYSAHPVACAAGLATQEIYKREKLLTRAQEIGKYLEDGTIRSKGCRMSSTFAISDSPLRGTRADLPASPAPWLRRILKCFESGVLFRASGDIVPLSPPLIIEKQQIDTLIATLSDSSRRCVSAGRKKGDNLAVVPISAGLICLRTYKALAARTPICLSVGLPLEKSLKYLP